MMSTQRRLKFALTASLVTAALWANISSAQTLEGYITGYEAEGSSPSEVTNLAGYVSGGRSVGNSSR